MRKYRIKSVFRAVRYDPANKPQDVETRVFGRNESLVVHHWMRSPDSWDGVLTVRPGQWMLTDSHGNRSVIDDDEFRMIYEEIPDAGEGGG